MPLSRRNFLKVGGMAGAALATTSCTLAARQVSLREVPESLQVPPVGAGAQPGNGEVPPVGPTPLWRFLNRAGYGPRPGDWARADGMGLEAALEEQLQPESLEDTAAELLVRGLTTYPMDADQLINQEPRDVAVDLAAATLGRAILSKRQLYEAMVEFWSDHFNIYVRKNPLMLPLKVVDDRDVIRPNALGTFRELLRASAQSPAMLVYLDNVQNRRGSPNENYARELMELHTLGVDAGYTQYDVEEVARALTGWGVQRRGPRRGRFRFYPEQHDNGAKRILGRVLPAGQGQEDVPQLLDRLVEHPATANHIAFKLVRRFVADEPPAGLVERVAGAFIQTGGDIKSLLRLIFLSEEFATAPPKLKRPYTFLISALRALNTDVGNYRALLRWLELLGQLPFHWPPPDGYPDVSAAWSANLLPRWNFGLALLENRLPGSRVPLARLVEAGQVAGLDEGLNFFARLILGRPLDDEARAWFRDYLGHGPLRQGERLLRFREALALLLASPTFQWT